jgi:16S rRNA (adenine1518-N6/adenine1519-N6)-dimethyltransferase
MIEFRSLIPEMVGMFQREVAQRICSGPGNKDYGILSVLLQAHYKCTYLFTLDEHAFIPPPKVKSGVIRCERLETPLVSDELSSFFKTVVKTGFNQRRKTLRNSLKSIGIVPEKFSQKRPEQLTVQAFVEMALMLREQAGN